MARLAPTWKNGEGTLDLDAAIDAYHALLDADAARDTFARLDRAIRARHMLVGQARDRLVCDVLRPRLLAPAQHVLLKAAAAGVGRAIQQVGQAALADEALLAPYALAPDERALLAVDPGYPGAARFGRLDGLLDPAGAWCSFVASSLESPTGIAYDDALAEAFLALPVMREFARRYRVRPFQLWRRLLGALLKAWEAWGGQGTPTLAIVDFRDAVTMPELEHLRDRFGAAGVPALIADPDELRYDGSALFLERDGRREEIGLVYRRVLQHEFLSRHGLGHPLVRAYAGGRVCVVNPFRGKPVHARLIMALISDEDGPGWAVMDDEARVAARAYVPWTRLVRPGPSAYQGEPLADLPDFVARNRERLVLKPNDAYGGGVLGSTVGEGAWRAAIAAALRGGPWVVQERVPVPVEGYPTWSLEEGLRIAPRYVDSGPCVFGVAPDIAAVGCLTRIVATPLLSGGAGGVAAPPTFLLG